MKTTDGLVIRCPECGALNVMLNKSMEEGLLSCMYCEGSINPHVDATLFKQSSNKVIP